jgi:hypothetical protein
MKVREETILTDPNLRRTGGQIDALIKACWVEVLDPGPYELENDALDWGKVLQCDRFHAFLRIRIATYGPELRLRCRVPGVPCAHRVGVRS